jgi:hemerythrin-like domain-containing protein
METETLGAALEREHREIDAAIEEFLSGEGGVEALGRATAALRRHIYLEEEFLFPPMEKDFFAPIFVMLREHGELWETMDAIEQGLAAGEADASVPGRCKWLLGQLDKHNAKEEPILYPHADAVLGAPASAELLEFLRAGRMPEGWVATRARG